MNNKQNGGDVALRMRPRRRGIARLALLAVVGAVLLGGSTAASYYVDALWFGSLGYAPVFWTRLNLQAATFASFSLLTFLVVYVVFRALKPDRLDALTGATILVNRRPVALPVARFLNLIGVGLSALIAAVTGANIAERWMTLALYWEAPRHATMLDPIFGRSLDFYLFTLPAAQLITGWLLTLTVIGCAMAAVSAALAGGGRLVRARQIDADQARLWRGVSIGIAAVQLALAARVYLGRFDRLFQDGTIFSGVTYTDAHITLTGMLIVAVAFVAGSALAAACAIRPLPRRWLVVSVVPAVTCYLIVAAVSSYVSSFIVQPNQLVKERPFIAHNIEMTRQAYALDRIETHAFPADTGIEALEAANNQATLENIRLWDWRALQDTLRQIQEIRTYYDFPDIDIDRYRIGGSVRQMMLATRELNVDKLPQSSRNWINEKLIYTHGYGVTMNPVNGFTPEGLPTLVLSNMPIQSTIPELTVTRPEIYFGELTNTDVYVKTRQKEFNYPQGDANNLTSYQGSGGIRLGGLLRRTLIALDRGDLSKLPFSDDVNSESRLLMRRRLSERVHELAPFLTLDADPYVIVGEDGRIRWLMDAFTTSDYYPFARRYLLGNERINYIRNSVKILIDAYSGETTFYVFDSKDPIIAAYRAIFPVLFADASAMPAAVRKHVRYPELLLNVQAAVYDLYHMTDPDVFYNREDLWSVATEIAMQNQRQQVMEPNFVLMTLPGERSSEFIAILPFTPANRNNLIGWIAGRSDGEHYGEAVVYNFPKTKLIDGPLQIEARIDQNAQLSGQLTLWNQQGSHVRRGSLIVIPIGRALLYAEPIYLQANRSPMPELRLVVLAVQDRLAYGPTFETAMAALFGAGPSMLSAQASPAAAAQPASTTAAPAAAGDLNALIAEAAQDFADYQQLTAGGKLAEAGQKLEALKRVLEQLQARRH
ncbi:MAG TPA: UPF0182 family protein [Steroidobacteraceae bacterium]|nr:UPF0182 family protein [Steroidobacteraceae bacterium]